jgi:uncharacterized lipoprotein YddW (UPF0748 family)
MSFGAFPKFGERKSLLHSKCCQKRHRLWFKISISALALFWLVLSIWQAPIVQTGKLGSQELRGIWMTNLGAALMYYTTRTDEVAATLARHRLNTLYPAVWNRGYTLHPSPVAKRVSGYERNPLTSLPLLPFQDVLSGLVFQAHRQHLRLIPWFEYGLMVPPQAALARQHPDWLTTTRTGAKTLQPRKESDRSIQKKVNPPPEAYQAWLNPAHPQVQQFFTDLIVDVVKRYPVDGIQLDDHFALPIEFGYDPYTAKLYRAEHNGQAPPNNTADSEWMRWRAAYLTDLMTRIAKAVKAEKPAARVSLSPNSPDFAYNKSLQDWPRWVELGLRRCCRRTGLPFRFVFARGRVIERAIKIKAKVCPCQHWALYRTFSRRQVSAADTERSRSSKSGKLCWYFFLLLGNYPVVF